ncbi:MAG TPA: hypothetical protein PLK94_06145 [Alphaproteobacteria bacterium]|nr:hypothetical protein [Alphaproteobacteria bacterium]HOO50852.1 hypothetical protein [Alphaproteobacteria bacterium]
MNEIADLIKEVEKADVIALSSHSDQSKSEYFKNFMEKNAQQIILHLYEMEELIRSGAISGGDSGGRILEKQSRCIVEGFSDESAAAALSDALSKASKYFSESVDINITLRQLTELSEGGHRATLELHITPLKINDRAHVKSFDVQNKKIRAAEFKKMHVTEEGERRHLVFDHFVPKMGATASGIPDNYLINIGDAHLMNYMIEKAFFKAGHEPTPHPDQIIVRRVDLEEDAPSLE